MTYTPPPFPAGLAPWKSKPSAKGLQLALKAAGYMRQGITLSNLYGPLTQAGVRSFHKANPAYGKATDSAIGPKGWAELHRQAYGDPKPAPVEEPAPDYNRVFCGGHVVNIRTRTLIERAEEKFGSKLTLSQGSYNPGGVAASAGTHDGGGVIDVSVNAYAATSRTELVRALREVGFAAWLRTPDEGFPYHIHACAIGDAEMAPLAVKQVADYFAGKNGLANHGPDTAPASVGRPYPEWAEKYKP